MRRSEEKEISRHEYFLTDAYVAASINIHQAKYIAFSQSPSFPRKFLLAADHLDNNFRYARPLFDSSSPSLTVFVVAVGSSQTYWLLDEHNEPEKSYQISIS